MPLSLFPLNSSSNVGGPGSLERLSVRQRSPLIAICKLGWGNLAGLLKHVTPSGPPNGCCPTTEPVDSCHWCRSCLQHVAECPCSSALHPGCEQTLCLLGHRGREEQLTGFLWRCVRLFWLVKFAQLLFKCPSHTKLCQERSGTVNLRIPSKVHVDCWVSGELLQVTRQPPLL